MTPPADRMPPYETGGTWAWTAACRPHGPRFALERANCCCSRRSAGGAAFPAGEGPPAENAFDATPANRCCSCRSAGGAAFPAGEGPPAENAFDATPASLRERLEAPVDSASLAVFRVAFGLILAAEVVRYAAYGWIDRDFLRPAFHFTFFGFDWVRPWPGAGMHLHFALMFVAALCVAVGYLPRLNAALLGCGMAYVFLLEKSNYLNHFYLVTLLCFLMAVPDTTRAWVPRWQLWLLRLQVAIPYVYGGIAKLSWDWLVRGEPMRAWLGGRVSSEPLILFTAWAGCLFDLLIVPALLWRRTRPLAIAAALVFHVTNSQLFEIGIFPWMMLAASTLFFEPDWPRRAAAALPVPPPASRLPLLPVALYVAVQLLLPFRHHLYPHPVMWSEEGQRFSWYMKSHHKECTGRFFARVLPDGPEWEIRAADYLTDRQEHAMLIWPDMIQDFARHAGEVLSSAQGRRVAVRAEVQCALNGRAPRPLVDPRVDLASAPRGMTPATWIMPLGD